MGSPAVNAVAPAPEGPRPWRYGELTRDDVVEAGLRLTRRSGFANLSMRKLAVELGSSSMNVYYYVRDKGHLLDLVGDAVLGEVLPPSGELPWEHRLTLLFERGREVLLRHPGVAQHLLRRREGLPNEIRLYRAVDEALSAGGFDRTVRNRTQRLLAYVLFGAVTSELATAEAAEELGTMTFADDEVVFHFGLELVLAGLRSRPGDVGQ